MPPCASKSSCRFLVVVLVPNVPSPSYMNGASSPAGCCDLLWYDALTSDFFENALLGTVCSSTMRPVLWRSLDMIPSIYIHLHPSTTKHHSSSCYIPTHPVAMALDMALLGQPVTVPKQGAKNETRHAEGTGPRELALSWTASWRIFWNTIELWWKWKTHTKV